MKTLEVVLGIPVTGEKNIEAMTAAIGQHEAFTKVWSQSSGSGKAHIRRFFEEWWSLAEALMRATNTEISMTCSNGHDRIRKDAESYGLKVINFGEVDVRATSFPRDLALQLHDGPLLVSSEEKPLIGPKVSVSPYGQGGKALTRGKVVIVASDHHWENDLRQLRNIRKRGFKTVELPAAYEVSPLGRFSGNLVGGPQDHIDRTCGLLEDSTGRLHLIVTAGQQTCDYTDGGMKLVSPEETAARYKQLCDKADINLHFVPVTIPTSTGFVQLQNGKVIITGGDNSIYEVIVDIAGTKNVITTDTPVCYYPAFCRAGIRCMVNELPSWFLNRWRKPAQSTAVRPAL